MFIAGFLLVMYVVIFFVSFVVGIDSDTKDIVLLNLILDIAITVLTIGCTMMEL